VTAAVYPGSFDPLTIAHVAIAEAALEQLDVARLDLAVSEVALGKAHLATSLHQRVQKLEQFVAAQPRLAVVVVTHRFVVDIASGYDAVVMGADKWAQVNDPVWYGGDTAARDAALAALPRVAVAPRSGYTTPAAHRLAVPPHLAEVSATAVRSGRREWAAAPVTGRSEPRRPAGPTPVD
jgi:hypothetical protein